MGRVPGPGFGQGGFAHAAARPCGRAQRVQARSRPGRGPDLLEHRPSRCVRGGGAAPRVRGDGAVSGGGKERHALVTGGAGFIGSHLVDRLLEEGWRVTVVDNFDPFYDPEMKERNVAPHRDHSEYRLYRLDIRDMEGLRTQLQGEYDVIVHLAAKAGVRPSIQDPLTYQEVNVEGTQNMLEFAKERGVRQFVFASSSSVYGVNPNVPWREDDHVLLPISPYASTKVSGELMGHVYSHLYGIRFIALRFFTVYGPRQRSG